MKFGGTGCVTGLDYFGARYFSAAQGRFTSPDEFTGGIVDPFTGQQVGQPGPLPYADITDPQTLNKYAYVRNNPLRYVDPDGHAEVDYDELLVNSTTALGAAFGMWTGGTIGGGGGTLLAPGVGTIGGAAGGAAVGGAVGAFGGRLVGKAVVALANMLDGDQSGNNNDQSSEQRYSSGKDNVDRMKQGKAPTGKDGKPVELHYEGQNPKGPVREMTRTEHRGPGNYTKNHPQGNRQPSRIDRNEAARQRRDY